MAGFLRSCFAIGLLAAAALPVPAAELVMVEEIGCPWCTAWEREVGPIYPKAPEAEIAPLRKLEMADVPSSSIEFAAPIVFTPTFVLVEDGEEIGRIEGYPGDEFFWVRLGTLLGLLDGEQEQETEQ